MKKTFYTSIMGFCLLCIMAVVSGCGGGDTSTPATPSKLTTTGSVTTDGTGAVAASTAVKTPTGSTITIPAGTVLTTDGTNAVAGTVPTTVSYSTSTPDLPAAAVSLPAGATLAAFLDIDMGAVKYFSKAVTVKMNVLSGGAAVGDTVAIYSFSTVTGTWLPVDTLTVDQDGTVTFTLRHLSIWAAFKTATPPPGKPSGIQASAGDSQVTVSWTAPTLGNPTSYNVYYGTSPGVTTANGKKVTVPTAATSQVVTGLTNGVPYYFVVTAVNANGEGGISSEKSAIPSLTAIPANPTGVSATAGTGKVVVAWKPVSGATSYNIYYSPTVTTPSALLTSGTIVAVPALLTDPLPASQSQEIAGLISGTPYYFVVTAVNTFGESGAQNSSKTATPL
jgi:hypothetical protein